MRTQEAQTAAARTNQHEGEEDAGTRPAGRGKETKRDEAKKKKEEERREKRENRIPGTHQAVRVRWVPVSARKPIR